MQEITFANKKEKILYLITKSNFGGAQRYVFDLATDPQIRDAYEIQVAVGGEGELISRLEQENVSIIHLSELKNSMSPLILWRQIKELRQVIQQQQPNILHINSSIAGLAGTIASIGLPCKTIFTAHGWPFNENRSYLIKILLRFVMSLVVTLSDRTIAVSKKTIADLPWITKKLIGKKVNVIYNGIEKRESNTVPALFDKNNFDTDIIHLVSIGELHPIKGHDMVIEALAEIQKYNNKNQYHYHIMGEGHYRPELEKIIEMHNLRHYVTLHGNVKDARDYLPQFDLFIMPSRSEALAFALLEAYASGIPVIFSAVGGMPEVREATDHGEMIQPNIESIATILLQKSKEFTHNGSTLTKRKGEIIFKKEKMLEETRGVYKELLQS